VLANDKDRLMNKSVMAAWPKDFETDLPIVPPGEFTDFSEYPNSNQPSRVRKLPVLRGFFDDSRFDVSTPLPAHMGWGTAPIGQKAVALTFRIQRGPNVLYWLANPADKRVWEVLDKWDAANRMVLAAEFKTGPTFLVARDFKLHPKLSAMRVAVSQAERLTPEFIADASMAIIKDEVKLMASTDIAAFAQLQQVQACMVRTQHTGGVAFMLNEGAPGPQGPVADAVAALSKAMLQPDRPRH